MPCDINFEFGTFGVMNGSTEIGYSYCGGMNCSFTVSDATSFQNIRNLNDGFQIIPMKNCKHLSTMIIPQLRLRTNSIDAIKIFDEKTLIATATSYENLLNHLIFEPNSTIKIEFSSDPDLFLVSKSPSAFFQILSLTGNRNSLKLCLKILCFEISKEQ